MIMNLAPILKSIEKQQIYQFITDEYQIILIGYPIWKAFISYGESNLWITTFFKIDINKKIIYFTPTKKAKNIKESSLLDILSSDSVDQDRIKIENFFNTITNDVREVVSKFQDSHWEMIETILMLGNDFIKLALTNPVLAYIVVNSNKINPSLRLLDDIEILSRMITSKQREILGKCGFPNTDQMVKIFSKIDPTQVRTNDLINLRSLLAWDSLIRTRILNVLSFAKIINKNILKLVIYNSPLLILLPNSTIYDLIQSEFFNQRVLIIRQLYINSKRWKIELPEIKSVQNLEQKLKKQLIEIEKKRKKEKSFPSPPLEDNFYITAICNERDLIYWSKRQNNCVRNYTKDILLGRSYIYRVEFNKEEATLELKLNDGKIRLGSLLATNNLKVSENLRIMVDNWLKESRKLLKRKHIKEAMV